MDSAPIPVTITADKVHEENFGLQSRCPMVHAIISDWSKVGDGNVPEWHPQLQSTRTVASQPSLLALSISSVTLDVSCQINTSFITMQGSWELHCIKPGEHCDCLLVVPMSTQGTITNAEIEIGGTCLGTLLLPESELENQNLLRFSNKKIMNDLEAYNPHLFMLKIPKVDSGATVSVKISWIQPMEFKDREISTFVPFNFSTYLKSKGATSNIFCTIYSGVEQTVIVGHFNHPLKEVLSKPGMVKFSLCNSEQISDSDVVVSYMVPLEGFSPLLLINTSNDKADGNEGTFYLCMYPSKTKTVQVPRRAIVFLLDRSKSMEHRTMESAREAIMSVASRLHASDCFSIIAFDSDLTFFSKELQSVNAQNLSKARDWLTNQCEPRGNTDLLKALKRGLQMLKNIGLAMPHIFLITDGSFPNEKNILMLMQDNLKDGTSSKPRISTFGIGRFCNYYFLRALADIGRGLSDVALYEDRIKEQMQDLFTNALFPVLVDISLCQELLDVCEVHPFPVPDMYCGYPWIVSGVFRGKLPDSIKLHGVSTATGAIEIPVKVREVTEIILKKIIAKQRLDYLTTQASLFGNKAAEERAVALSLDTGVPCEYTCLTKFETTSQNFNKLPQGNVVEFKKYVKKGSGISVLSVLFGFGDMAATLDNLPSVGSRDYIPHLIIEDYSHYCFSWCVASGVCCCCLLKQDNNSFGAACCNCIVTLCQNCCMLLLCASCLEICFDMCSSCC